MPLTTPTLLDIEGLCQAKLFTNSLPKYEHHQQRSFFQQCPFERTMDCVIRREIVVARSGRFSEIVVARSGGFSDIVVARSGVFRDDW